MTAPTSGMSQPSVNTMQFVTRPISPDASRCSVESRSGFGVPPSMCSARTPDSMNSFRRWTECETLTAKATVFRRSPNLCQWLDDIANQLRAIHALGELRLGIVPGLGADPRQVRLHGRIAARPHQVFLLDQRRDLRALDDFLEDTSEPAAVAPARRRGQAKHHGVGVGGDNFLIAQRWAVVGLVDDRQIGIGQLHDFAVHGPGPQGLHRRDLHALGQVGRDPRLDDSVREAAVTQLRAGLRDDLAAVGQNENRLMLGAEGSDDLGANDGFPRARWGNQDDALDAALDRPPELVNHGALVGAKFGGAHAAALERGCRKPARSALRMVASTDRMPSSLTSPF